MTLEERSRAKKLEKLLMDYGKIIITRRGVMKVIVIIMALSYLLWFLVDARSVPSIHVFFAIVIMGIYTEDNVGDGGATQYSDIGLSVIGSSGTGTFFCTLPFKARDILNMRFRRFEINLAFINLVALLNQILFIIMYGGIFPSGYCIALILIAELLFMAVMFIRHYQIKLYSNLAIFVFFIVLSNSAFVPDTKAYKDTLPLMKAFHFMDGWVGAAALVIVPLIILTAGEFYLKNKKDPSWNLR